VFGSPGDAADSSSLAGEVFRRGFASRSAGPALERLRVANVGWDIDS